VVYFGIKFTRERKIGKPSRVGRPKTEGLARTLQEPRRGRFKPGALKIEKG